MITTELQGLITTEYGPSRFLTTPTPIHRLRACPPRDKRRQGSRTETYVSEPVGRCVVAGRVRVPPGAGTPPLRHPKATEPTPGAAYRRARRPQGSALRAARKRRRCCAVLAPVSARRSSRRWGWAWGKGSGDEGRRRVAAGVHLSAGRAVDEGGRRQEAPSFLF